MARARGESGEGGGRERGSEWREEPGGKKVHEQEDKREEQEEKGDGRNETV